MPDLMWRVRNTHLPTVLLQELYPHIHGGALPRQQHKRRRPRSLIPPPLPSVCFFWLAGVTPWGSFRTTLFAVYTARTGYEHRFLFFFQYAHAQNRYLVVREEIVTEFDHKYIGWESIIAPLMHSFWHVIVSIVTALCKMESPIK